MKVKCPYCGREIEVNFEDDLEESIWNFDGKTALIEMYPYCKECEEYFEVYAKYSLTPIPNEIQTYEIIKKR